MYQVDRERCSFAHRNNDDGSFDSICHSCFQTIAQSECEQDLQAEERGHVCNPATVEHYRGLIEEVSDYRGEKNKGHAQRV
jgi:hypothetical protein